MKKLLQTLSLIFSISIVNNIQAQSVWAKQLGGTMAEKGIALTVDAGGNIYSVGTFSGTCDFDPSAATFTMTSAGNTDVYISKLTSTGNFLWAKKIGSTSIDNVADITLDATGNIYFTGEFSGTVDFDPGAATVNMISPSTTTDAFICKLDMNGNYIWAKQMTGQWWEAANSIDIDAAGDVIITGDFSTNSTQPADFDPGPGTFTFTTGTTGNTDIFIVKLTSAGIFVWAKQIGGINGDFGNSLETDNLNNIHIGGYFTGTTDFDPNAGTTNLVSFGFEDIYILKLDAAGNFVWAKNMGSNTVDYCRSIALDALGNVYSTGSFRSTCDFDPGPATYTLATASGDDIFISKLDASGNFVWAKSMGGSSADLGYSIATDASGNVYTTGIFRNTVDFDSGAGTYSLTSLGSADVFVHKLNSAGNFLWAGQFGGSLDDYGQGITLDASGNIHTTGYFGATCDFDATSALLNLTSLGQTDAFVQKMCQTTSQPGAISGPNSLCGNATNTYSIAPVAGATFYTWTLPSGWSGTSTTNTISATTNSSGAFTLTASNSCGASSPQTLSVTINALPTVTAITSNTLICVGQTATLNAGGANLYVWSPSGSGASIVVSPTITTNYIVTGLDVNGCQNTATVSQVVSNCAGINSFTQEQLSIKLYPNPTNEILNIDLEAENEVKVQIVNCIGQVLLSENATAQHLSFNIQNFKAGIYFVVLKTKTNSVTRKIVKE